MKAFFYALLGAAAGIAIIHFAYKFINFAILPSLAVYAAMYLSAFGALKNPTPSVLCVAGVSLYGMIFYGIAVYYSIINYPVYRTIFGIISDIITVLAFLSAAIMFIPIILKNSRRLRGQQPKKRLPVEWRFSLVVVAILIAYLSVVASLAQSKAWHYALVCLWNVIMVSGYVFLPISLARRHRDKGGENPVAIAVCAIGVCFFVHIVLLILGNNTIDLNSALEPLILSLIGIWGSCTIKKASHPSLFYCILAKHKFKLAASKLARHPRGFADYLGRSVGCDLVRGTVGFSESIYQLFLDQFPSAPPCVICRGICLSCIVAIIAKLWGKKYGRGCENDIRDIAFFSLFRDEFAPSDNSFQARKLFPPELYKSYRENTKILNDPENYHETGGFIKPLAGNLLSHSLGYIIPSCTFNERLLNEVTAQITKWLEDYLAGTKQEEDRYYEQYHFAYRSLNTGSVD